MFWARMSNSGISNHTSSSGVNMLIMKTLGLILFVAYVLEFIWGLVCFETRGEAAAAEEKSSALSATTNGTNIVMCISHLSYEIRGQSIYIICKKKILLTVVVFAACQLV
jgi:hypothetical protein